MRSEFSFSYAHHVARALLETGKEDNDDDDDDDGIYICSVMLRGQKLIGLQYR
jgi:hypothetical protein